MGALDYPSKGNTSTCSAKQQEPELGGAIPPYPREGNAMQGHHMLEDDFPRLLASLHKQIDQEPEIPAEDTEGSTQASNKIQDVYVLVVRERGTREHVDTQEDNALETTLAHAQKTQEEPDLLAYVPCLFGLVVILSCLAFQLYLVFNPPTVTVTMLAKSQTVSLTGTLQLGRLLNPITVSQSTMAVTTGKGHQDSRQAAGLITFYNGQFQSVAVPARTIITAADGVQIATDQGALLPAGNPPAYGQTTVSAHAIIPGIKGNIAAYAISVACCAPSVLAKNTQSFTGGQDERDFHTVTQSDIDQAATPLNTTLAQSVQGALHGQVKNSEALQTLPCTPTVQSDHQAGQEAREVKVTVAETCSAVAYNNDALQAQATALLTTRATQQVGAGYTLVGAIHVTLCQATVSHTTPTLVFSCQGVWMYGGTNAQQQLIKNLIAGKTKQQALDALVHLPGIQQARIGDVDDNAKLPRNPGLIHLIILV